MEKYQPVRTCVCCRGKFFKKDLLRVVRLADGSFCVDESGKSDGRGAYVCKNAECIKKLNKTKAFDRAFKTKLPPDIYALSEDAVANEK